MSNYYMVGPGDYREHIGKAPRDFVFTFQGNEQRTVSEWVYVLSRMGEGTVIEDEHGVEVSLEEFWALVGRSLMNRLTFKTYAENPATPQAERDSIAMAFLRGNRWLDGPFDFSRGEWF